MNIQGINQYQRLEARYKASKQGPKISRNAQTKPRDTFEPSHRKLEIREDLVNAVKKKIRLGYYSSETVLDDLSNSFAKALNAAQ
jgi:anti-sigma28 factor (negative regulator of flagellin synthesis)